jgi:hypothetical protein
MWAVLIRIGHKPAAGFCEHDNNPSGEQFLDYSIEQNRTGFLKLWYAYHQWYTGLVRNNQGVKKKNLSINKHN